VPRRSPSAALLAASVAGVLGVPACGGGDDAGSTRAEQVREVALDAGLSEEVADVLALAARGGTATFQVTYPGEDGAALVVSQQPPNRRIDAVAAGLIVQSQVVLDDTTYTCDLPDGGSPGDALECRRTQAAAPAHGAFTPEALEDFAEDLAERADRTELRVEARTIADVEARCLVAEPRDGGDAETICVGPDGAQLLLDAGGQRVEADAYTPDVPDGTFDL